MAYSMDLRLKILAALDSGDSVAATARRFGVSEDTARAHRRRRDTLGSPAPFKTGPQKPIKITPSDDTKMLALIKANPGVTLNAIRAQLHVKVVESTVCRRLKKLSMSFKKRA